MKPAAGNPGLVDIRTAVGGCGGAKSPIDTGAVKMSVTCRRLLLAAIATAGLSACASGSGPHVPIPDESGLYAIPALRADADDEDVLQRLDGPDQEWEIETWAERVDLSPDVQFVIRDPAVAAVPGEHLIELWKVAWVRSDLRNDGQAQPVDGSDWAVARLDPFRVPLAYRGVSGQADTIHVVPQQRLAPGLYSLQLRNPRSARSARFGVDWQAIDRRQYAAAHCVDRRLAQEPAYMPCAGAQASSGQNAGKGLQISLVDPVARTVSGERILLLRGTITNESTVSRSLPLLVAALQDQSGTVLGRWTFAAGQTRLDAGQSATFRTEIRNAPAGTARVNVSFARDASTAGQ